MWIVDDGGGDGSGECLKHIFWRFSRVRVQALVYQSLT
jgi:hypothetical protein